MWERTLQEIGEPQVCKLAHFSLKKQEYRVRKFNEKAGQTKAGPG